MALDAFIERMPFQVPLDAEVGSLAAGERQKTEILKQLYLERRLLVLDEPTSVLTPQEADEMLGLVRGLAHSGAITAIVITHKLKEVAKFADEVTVLRRGRRTGGGPAAGLDARRHDRDDDRRAAGARRRPSASARRSPTPRLELRGVTTAGDQGRAGLAIESLTVRPREIVGIAGVSGNGQATLVEVLGGQRAPSGGQVLVEGAPYDGSRDLAQARAVRVCPRSRCATAASRA